MESKEENDKDKDYENKMNFWKKYSVDYAASMEFTLMQASTLLYSQTRCWEASRILDAGAGSGRPSRMFVASYMQSGAHYYNTDFSPQMLELFEAGFKASGLCDGDSIKLVALDKADMHTVQAFDPDVKTKSVYFGFGDNQKLPFGDASFDRYISNSTLSFVDDPQAQINEAYRVLEDGGV